METLPLVSIITPSYNQGDYLEETILSVLEQDYPNIEYWIIDGESTDESLNIIKKYEHRITGWVSEKDHGQADAINKGLRLAKGEIVAWLNSDDIYRPGAIASAVKALTKHTNAGLVYSNVDSIDALGEVFNRMVYDTWKLEDLMCFCILGQASVFMRRDILDRVGFLDIDYHYLLDHHLWLRIALVSDTIYIPGQCWAAARMHPMAKNVKQVEGFGKEAFKLVEWMHDNPAFCDTSCELDHKMWAGAHRLNGFYLLEGEYHFRALKSYLLGFWHHPVSILPDWKRVVYAAFAPLGLKYLKNYYYRQKKRKILKRYDNDNNKRKI